MDNEKLRALIEQVAKPYFENCAFLGRDAYIRINMFAKALASNIIKEIERQALTTKQT